MTLVLVAFGCAGCARAEPTGIMVSETLELGQFNAVSIVGSWNIHLAFGEEARVEIVGDAGILAKKSVRVEENKLYLALRRVSPENAARAYISLPTGTELSFDGPISATTSGSLRAGVVRIVVLGSASLFVNDLVADQASVHVAEGSSLSVRGSAQSLSLVVDRDSTVFLDELKVGNLSLELRGGSVVTVRVSEGLDGTASGGSAVYVTGAVPSVNVTTRGGACVIHVEEIGPDLRQSASRGPSCQIK